MCGPPCRSRGRNCAFFCILAHFPLLIEGVGTQMQDLDALFVVSWETWRKQWFSGMPVDMCMAPLADHEADEASGEDEEPPLPAPPKKNGKQMHQPHL